MLFRSPRLPRVLASTLAFLFFALCCQAGIAAGAIKIGTVVWIGYGPFYVADALDLYKKHGVKVTLQYFTDPALIPPAIAGGSVDGGMLTYDQAHPKEITAIIKGYLDGMAYMTSNPDDAAKLIGKAMGVTADEVREQLSGVYNIPAAEMPKNFIKSKDTTSLYASGAVIGKILIDNGQIKKTPAIEDTYDDALLKGVLKK